MTKVNQQTRAYPTYCSFLFNSIIHFYILSYCISLLLDARIFPSSSPIVPTFLFPRIQIYMYTEMFSSELFNVRLLSITSVEVSTVVLIVPNTEVDQR